MPLAKENFIKRMETFENIVSPADPNDSLLVSRSLTETLHNEKVRMLRNGLAIIGYTILEDFIKKRTGEVLKEVGRTGVSFNRLPEKLRETATFSALKGVLARADVLKRASEDFTSYVQRETGYLASTSSSVYEFSEFSLGWDKSNLSATDISDFLAIFNVMVGGQQ